MTDADYAEGGLHRHTQEIKERYPEPLNFLIIELAEMNREKWLDGEDWRSRTLGAEKVRETGLTANQYEFAEQIAEQMEESHDDYR